LFDEAVQNYTALITTGQTGLEVYIQEGKWHAGLIDIYIYILMYVCIYLCFVYARMCVYAQVYV